MKAHQVMERMMKTNGMTRIENAPHVCFQTMVQIIFGAPKFEPRVRAHALLRSPIFRSMLHKVKACAFGVLACGATLPDRLFLRIIWMNIHRRPPFISRFIVIEYEYNLSYSIYHILITWRSSTNSRRHRGGKCAKRISRPPLMKGGGSCQLL